MGDEFTLEDALVVLRRRALFFLIPAVLIAVLGVAVVMLLPAKYTAQGTILVESAQIPSDLVRSTVNAYAQERIQVIRQRVMTREKLIEIADKYQVFPADERLTASARVQKMRERLSLALITADGARPGGQRDGTIAFTIGYTDRSPDKAHQVANEFMSLFLTEDVRSRTAGASNTTEFFDQETRRLAASVEAVEAKIAEYKAANSDALPEFLNMHMTMLDRAAGELATAQAALTALDEEMRYLETQLATYFAGAAGENGPAQEIARLKNELAQLRSVYRDAHPTVQGVRDQIRALEAQMAPSREIKDLQSALKNAEIDLKKARETLPETDPKIEAAKADVAAAQQKLSDRVAAEAASGRGDLLSSQLQGRLSVAQSRRDGLLAQIDEARARIEGLKGRIDRTPAVERGLQALTRDYENLFKEYQDILAKRQEAELAQNLEKNQRAEKFSILEPAMRPEKPSSPERIKLSVLALFAALAAGAAAALGIEFLGGAVRGRAHLARIAGAEPIAVIPNFRRERQPGRRKPVEAAAAAA